MNNRKKTRVCQNCKEEKPLDQFMSNYRIKNKKTNKCKQCNKTTRKELRITRNIPMFGSLCCQAAKRITDEGFLCTECKKPCN